MAARVGEVKRKKLRTTKKRIVDFISMMSRRTEGSGKWEIVLVRRYDVRTVAWEAKYGAGRWRY